MGAWAPRWRNAPGLLLAVLAALSGCSSTPPVPSSAPPSGAPFDAQRDGAPKDPPPDLIDRPDPEPRIEPIRSGGPNKPYAVLGQRYTPLAADAPLLETGLASWYGRKFHGRPTASGEIYDMYATSAAHRTMPIPSFARVRNPANGREIVVRINDRGPFHADRIIDLSYAAALKLGVLRGVAPVEVTRLTHDDIRSGRWRDETALVLAAAPAPARAPVPGPAPALAPMPVPAPAAARAAAPALPAVPAAAGTGPIEQAQAGGAQQPEARVPALPPTAELQAAAQALDQPRLVVAAPTVPAQATAAAGFWVQLGAFRQRQSAFDLRQQLQRELAWIEPWLSIFDDSAWFKLQAGPFASRAEAQGAAERLRGASAVQPLILQRR
jgi:rare lipoprotein A